MAGAGHRCTEERTSLRLGRDRCFSFRRCVCPVTEIRAMGGWAGCGNGFACCCACKTAPGGRKSVVIIAVLDAKCIEMKQPAHSVNTRPWHSTSLPAGQQFPCPGPARPAGHLIPQATSFVQALRAARRRHALPCGTCGWVANCSCGHGSHGMNHAADQRPCRRRHSCESAHR